jgi:hypothetical protein
MASERREGEASRDGPDEELRKSSEAKGRNRPARAERPRPVVISTPPRRIADPQKVNSLSPSRARERAPASASLDPESRSAESGSPGAQGSEKPSVSAGAESSDTFALPASVRDRFVEVKHRFYFQDGAPAFRDHGLRLTTGSENTEVIQSLIQIARTRGWDEITVNGTERFRQEAWRQGHLAGLTVRGYRATEPERAAVVRSLARRAQGAQMELEVGEGGPQRSDGGAPAQPQTSAQGVSEPQRSERARGDLLVGKLIDHGREPYRFDPKEPMSYFVEIEMAQGKRRTIWGKDLERAVKESLSKLQIGDEIGLRRTGADRVTVQRKERDGEGKVIAEREVGTERNRWVLEKREFFESRAVAAEVVRNPAVDRRQAVRSHPELVGTYLQLHAAELASRQIRDPEDQKKFVTLVRKALADSVARGEPLQPVRLRDRPQRAPERKAREREPGPVRT